MTERAFQDYYATEYSHCYGCGRSNPHGLHLKSFWDGDTTIAHFTPAKWHTGGVPHHTYGGLIASLFDCHGTASAAAAAFRREQREMGTEPAIRFVTASLTVNFLRPTPIDGEFTLRGKVTEQKERKAIIEMTLSVAEHLCAKATMVAIRWQGERDTNH
ncbi:PaaI family thioesterase [Maribrevibacterium harenarium]|uniref:Acyl-coenzyme A thioesterase THEM4 n=1 Tax=Maribrevibacterium harenarium TaxID=2589817 RepID=A0A501WLL1_9GAMM|nr:PaaI family thioesterase [Maribrevibacterium harenarium]TPE48097.1 PaaI family thioesterase [Maribrevibacterium harenarium]